MSEGSELTDMLKALLEDRQRREEELADERREREEERRRRDEELAEERRRRDEELGLLKRLVEERGRTAAAMGPRSDGEVKIAKLTDTDDIEAYLTTFERMMAAYDVPRSRWVCKIAPQLTGKAQQAYAAMDVTAAAQYDEVKAAILRRYDISDETYQQRFRAATRKEDETHRQLAV